MLDADEPGLQALARGQRAAMAQTGAVDGGQAQADAPDPAVSAFAASGARSLVYSGDGTGVFTLRASIAADAGAGLVSTPQGRTLFLVTEALHRSGSDQPQAAGGVFRSEDQGLRWSYDAQVALGAPERRALFLSETRAVALESRDGGERLLYTEDGARRWQAATIMEQVWPMPAPTARPSTRRPKGRVDWGRRTGWNIAGRCIRWAKRRPSAGAGACACRPARKRRSSSRRAVSRSPSRTARLRPSASSRRRRRAVPGRVRRIPC